MNEDVLDRKPYDRARLDMIAGAAKGVVLDLSPDRFGTTKYLESQGVKVIRDEHDPRELGGAIGWYALPRQELGERIARIAETLVPGAPLLLTFLESEVRRKEMEALLSAIPALTGVRIEGRRAYPFEEPIGRVFVFAKRA